MRVHTLQHVPFEGLGSMQAWLAVRAAQVTFTRLFEEPRFPPLREIDWLLVMGGPMSVNDAEEHRWLAAEKRFIAEAIAASKVVLGVCLGAQLIASALGRLPLVYAPAMHLSLAQNPVYRRHLETLGPYAALVPPRLGEGKAKVALPEDIARFVARKLARGPLAGSRIVVTAGSTRAPIDRFRYVGNRSSGRLGVAIAEELWLRGAEVVLVYGPAEAEPAQTAG